MSSLKLEVKISGESFPCSDAWSCDSSPINSIICAEMCFIIINALLPGSSLRAKLKERHCAMKRKLKFETPQILEGVRYEAEYGLMVMSNFEAEIEHEVEGVGLTYEDFDTVANNYWD